MGSKWPRAVRVLATSLSSRQMNQLGQLRQRLVTALTALAASNVSTLKSYAAANSFGLKPAGLVTSVLTPLLVPRAPQPAQMGIWITASYPVYCDKLIYSKSRLRLRPAIRRKPVSLNDASYSYFTAKRRCWLRLNDLERRIRVKIPDVLARQLGWRRSLRKLPRGSRKWTALLACILFPVVLNAPASFDRMVEIATKFRGSLFFIFISDDIPASDYKRLVQTGGADWASTRGAPQEIADILARIEKNGAAADPTEPSLTNEPVMVAFVPSAGGWSSTLAIEVGVQLKMAKRTRSRRICLLDLDFQNSHVCDFLDIEPRMQFVR